MPSSWMFHYRREQARGAWIVGGFSLIELIITVSILGILAAIAIPVMLAQRITANHSMAIGALKTVFAAQTDYNHNSAPHRFASSLTDLGTGSGAGNVGFVDNVLAGGTKSGYTFNMIAEAVDATGLNTTWSAEAHPMIYRRLGVLSFYIDDTGLIRAQDVGGAAGTVAMRPTDSFN